MDMVCEKALDVDHDFDRDPIQWQIEGDWITTGGRTTLGADDGIGVAYGLAVLADDSLPHPELEVLFTTAEEEDLSGADQFDPSKIRAARLINLDHTCDREIVCGSCGGMEVDIRLPVIADTPPEGWRPYRLSVSGLKGGHSGEDIHCGQGNANVLLNRMLMAMECCCAFRLGAIRGAPSVWPSPGTRRRWSGWTPPIWSSSRTACGRHSCWSEASWLRRQTA